MSATNCFHKKTKRGNLFMENIPFQYLQLISIFQRLRKIAEKSVNSGIHKVVLFWDSFSPQANMFITPK